MPHKGTSRSYPSRPGHPNPGGPMSKPRKPAAPPVAAPVGPKAATKTLPAQASSTAKERAFGQQGAATRATQRGDTVRAPAPRVPGLHRNAPMVREGGDAKRAGMPKVMPPKAKMPMKGMEPPHVMPVKAKVKAKK